MLSFAHLNLYRNPFGEPSRQERAELALIEDIDVYVSDLKNAERVAIQFMGDGGRGKSTHLIAIHSHFPDRPFIYLAEGERRIRFPSADSLFIDEAQRIPKWRRHLLFRRPCSMALATHDDLSAELTAAGYVVRTVDVDIGHSFDRLHAIFEHRISSVQRDINTPRPHITRAATEALCQRYGSNIRAMESHLYDVFQTMKEIKNAEV